MGGRIVQKELRARMRQLKIYEKDLEETFIRSSGPGGQNVNKVATCVQLLHRPSEIIIKCQRARTQGLNRLWARAMLIEKIEKQMAKDRYERIQTLEKKKRQTRKRTTKIKEGILEQKHRRSEKKESRRKIRTQALDNYL